jgi:hypothetical protein
MQAQKTGRTLMAEIWRLVVSGTVESRPQFPPIIQALVWGLNIWERAKVHPFQLKYIYTYYVSFKFVYYLDIHYGVDFHCGIL